MLILYFFSAFAYRNELPRGVHQWAQADRYAIAAKYVDGQSFMHPASYSIISDNGEVGVEFPLIQFTSAKLARLFDGKKSLPFIYRTLTFLLFYSGFFLLFYEIFRSKSVTWFIAVHILFFSSPLLFYYSHNFSADAAAAGLALAAMGVSLRDARRFYLISILLFLAALIKTSSGIFLIAYSGSIFLMDIKNFRTFNYWVRALFFILLVSIVGWYDYVHVIERNKELWSTLFLSDTNALSSFAELREVLKGMWKWRMEYLNAYQWIIVIIGFVYFFKMDKSKFINTFTSLICLGLIAILILFGRQFINHDYYVLATFIPLILFCSALGFYELIKNKGKIALFAVSLLVVLSFSEGSNQHFDRMSEDCVINDQAHHHYFEWLVDLQKETDKLIAADEKVFVVYQIEPNLSLSYIDRMGIVFNPEEMGREESNFYYWLERRQPHFVVCKQQFMPQFKQDHRAFVERCSIHTFEKFSILRINGY